MEPNTKIFPTPIDVRAQFQNAEYSGALNDWETYTNVKYNFSVKYPTYLEPKEVSDSEVLFTSKRSGAASVDEYRVTVNKMRFGYDFDTLYNADYSAEFSKKISKSTNYSIDGKKAVALNYFALGFPQESKDDLYIVLIKKDDDIIEVSTQLALTGLITDLFLSGISFD